MQEKDKKQPFYLNVESIERHQDEIVFWSLNANRLLSCNISEGRSNRIYDLSGETVLGEDILKTPFQYTSSTHDENYAYFAPFESDKICRYSFDSKKVDFIPLMGKGKFSSAFIHDDKLYLWGWRKGNVKSVALKDNVICDVECFKEIDVTSNPIMIEDEYYFTINKPDLICSFNPRSSKCRIHTLYGGGDYYNTISYTNGVIWLSGTNNLITLWDKKKDDVKKIALPDNLIIAEHFWSPFLFKSSIAFGQYVYFSPYKAKHLIRINRDNKKVELLLMHKKANGGGFVKIDDDEMHFIIETLEHNALGEYMIRGNGDICESTLFTVHKDSYIAIKAPITPMYLSEDECFSLVDFMDYIMDD